MRTNTPPPARSTRLGRLAALAPWLAGLIFFALYAATTAPSLVTLFDDSLEFQLVLPTFALAHPTGYPLYTLLGGLWSRVIFPFGSWAWRVNLFSALAAGATVGLVFALAQRLVSGDQTPDPATASQHAAASSTQAITQPVTHSAEQQAARRLWLGLAAGTAAALIFGLGPVWSAQATLAEVYALHNLLLAAALLVTLTLPPRRQDTRDRPFVLRMALLALLLGLGLAHHRTIVLAVPGIALYLLWSVEGIWRPRRAWLLWLAALLAPLLLYLYLPLRAAASAVDLHGSYTNTWDGFWNHVLARGYTGFFSASPLAVDRTAGQWFDLFVAQAGWLGLALAVLGLVWAFLPSRAPTASQNAAGAIPATAPPYRPYWDAQRKGWLLIGIVLLTNLLFALAYRVPDQEVFLLPVFLCLALLAGGGTAAIGRLAAGRAPWPAAALLVALLVLLLWNPGRGPITNRSGDWAAHDYAVDLAKTPFGPGSTVIGLEGEITALKYMQAAEGLGAAAAGIAADDPTRRRDVLAATIAGGLPVYLTRELEGIATDYSFSGTGPLIQVFPRGKAQAGAPQTTLDIPLDGGRLLLAGYDLQRLDWAGGPALRVDLLWQPAAELPRPLKVSLRLLGPDAAPLRYADGSPATLDAFPLRGVAPTPTWLPGETIRDVYTLYLPPAAVTHPTTLQVILYDAETLAEVGRWETPLPAQ